MDALVSKAAQEVQTLLADARPLGLALGYRKEDARGFAARAAQALTHAPQDAEVLAQLAVDCDAGLFEAQLLLGLARAHLGAMEGAVQALRVALGLRPTHLATLMALGEAEIACCQYTDAAGHLRTLMELDKEATTPEGRRARMVLAKTLGKLKKASK